MLPQEVFRHFFGSPSLARLDDAGSPLSKNELMRLLQIVDATTPSAGAISEATKQAILDRAKAVIEELERERAA
jgi:hypothetical protein